MNKKYSFIGLVIVLLFMVLSGCVYTTTMISPSVERGEIKLSDYKYSYIYPSDRASLIQLELETLFDSIGIKVIDIKQASEIPTLGVRYLEVPLFNGYGKQIGIQLTIEITDYGSGKTLFTTCNSTDFFSPMPRAWDKSAIEIKKVFKDIEKKNNDKKIERKKRN